MMKAILQNGAIRLVLCLALLAWGIEARAANAPRAYDTPEDAAAALAAAVKAHDLKELLAIFGPKAEPLVASGDTRSREAERNAFVEAYEKKHSLIEDEADASGAKAALSGKSAKAGAGETESRILVVGPDDWPFPIPLVRDAKSGRWFFDTPAGFQELLNRRIGNNELSAVQAALAYVDAQKDYYRMNPEKSQVPHFAQKITSSPGKRDGLYWPAGEGEEESPLGELIAVAEGKAHAAAPQGGGYHGYRYHILTGQGPNAAGGAYNYVENGLMFGGFALLAYPEAYGVSGIMTFMVNQDGVVFEKNLGKNTATLARSIKLFDPDASWIKISSE